MCNNGNIAYIADNVNTGWTQSFAYDGLNRLLTASRSDGAYNHTYNYDSFGNLTIQPLGGWPSGQAYSIDSATNRLLMTANGAPEYTYDAAGNVVNSGTGDIGGHTFTYNALNQITHMDAGAASYYYNAQDQRIFDANQLSWKNYYYFGGQPFSEYNLSDGSWTDYIYAEGQKIAKVTAPLGGAGTLNYYLDDHLGTTQVELDASGHVTWQGQFTPFGSELADGTTTMHYKFTGKERDAESGLDYFGARYYGSVMGRFMSPDWAAKAEPVPYSKLDNPQTLNLYGYVGNNPLTRFDKDGHVFDCDACKKVINAVKGIFEVKSTIGSGYAASGSFGGVKIEASASTKTETTVSATKKTKQESFIEKGIKAKVGTVNLAVASKTPIGSTQGSVEGSAGLGGGPVKEPTISTDHSISLAGVEVGVGPLLMGAEIQINTQEVGNAVTNFGPAIRQSLQTTFGNTFNTPGPGSGSGFSIFNLPER